jgi:hypothetical protein
MTKLVSPAYIIRRVRMHSRRLSNVDAVKRASLTDWRQRASRRVDRKLVYTVRRDSGVDSLCHSRSLKQ